MRNEPVGRDLQRWVGHRARVAESTPRQAATSLANGAVGKTGNMKRNRSLIVAGFAVFSVLATLLSTTSVSAQNTLGLADRSPDRLAVGAVLHSYDPGWDDGVYAQTAAEEFDAITTTAYMPFGAHPTCLLYTSPSPRDRTRSRMPSSA